MKIKEYQEKSIRTMPKEYEPQYDVFKTLQICNMIFGLEGEAGEVTDILKKHLFHGHELDKKHLKEELGDIMFYLVNLVTLYNIDMSDVLEINVDKLLKRYPQGFDKEKSIYRES
ncbi:nucleoside triphosphate pyrophosphohydrolase family protein [Clostridium sp. HBUAS56017]|uniref:nucleoside triphosphate pyrophosphohydrolase family protein n=1 Tax=Clostridium sp. HBUAS56017 TaxID=2571128 RepID=UPI00117808DF|nr:nucleoside triphosphate pyrophosphohydrolase family protein [Clostridium sp. HBUAS56017]